MGQRTSHLLPTVFSISNQLQKQKHKTVTTLSASFLPKFSRQHTIFISTNFSICHSFTRSFHTKKFTCTCSIHFSNCTFLICFQTGRLHKLSDCLHYFLCQMVVLFSVTSPEICNSLPPALHSCNCPNTFPWQLKTPYFQQTFSSPQTSPSLRLRFDSSWRCAYSEISFLNISFTYLTHFSIFFLVFLQ